MQNEQNRDRLMLGLLTSVEQDAQRTQRSRASEIDAAVGLVNTYLHYCIKKGFVRVSRVPARRYLYFLTPQGFAEKSRLSLQLISKSLVSFRQARRDYSDAFARLHALQLTRVTLIGQSELAEIALLCALENGIQPLAVVDASGAAGFTAVPVMRSLDDVPGGVEAAVITDLAAPQASFDIAVAKLGRERVIAPAILGLRPMEAT